MIVDDEPQIGKMLTQFLGKHNCRVIFFTNGKDALACLKSNRVNLLLTDMTMPGITGIPYGTPFNGTCLPVRQACLPVRQVPSGIELARQVKTLYPALPVIVMSGLADGRDRDEIFSLGADFIPKPFDLVELLKRINSHKEYLTVPA